MRILRETWRAIAGCDKEHGHGGQKQHQQRDGDKAEEAKGRSTCGGNGAACAQLRHIGCDKIDREKQCQDKKSKQDDGGDPEASHLLFEIGHLCGEPAGDLGVVIRIEAAELHVVIDNDLTVTGMLDFPALKILEESGGAFVAHDLTHLQLLRADSRGDLVNIAAHKSGHIYDNVKRRGRFGSRVLTICVLFGILKPTLDGGIAVANVRGDGRVAVTIGNPFFFDFLAGNFPQFWVTPLQIWDGKIAIRDGVPFLLVYNGRGREYDATNQTREGAQGCGENRRKHPHSGGCGAKSPAHRGWWNNAMILSDTSGKNNGKYTKKAMQRRKSRMNNTCKDMQQGENGKMTLEELRRMVTELVWKVEDEKTQRRIWAQLERAWAAQW